MKDNRVVQHPMIAALIRQRGEELERKTISVLIAMAFVLSLSFVLFVVWTNTSLLSAILAWIESASWD